MVMALLCWKLLCLFYFFLSFASFWSQTSQDLMRLSAWKREAAGNQPNVGCTRLPPVNMHHGKLTGQLTNAHMCRAFVKSVNIDYLEDITHFSIDVRIPSGKDWREVITNCESLTKCLYHLGVHSTCSISALIVVTPNDSLEYIMISYETALRKNSVVKTNPSF